MVELNDDEFIASVTSLGKAFSTNTHQESQIDQFFRLSESRKRLPKGSNNGVTESFLATVVSIISMKTNINHTLKAIKLLHTFLRFDQAVFALFKPNKPLLRKMNLQEHIMSANPNEVEATLELAAFLLRYHRAIDYGDFSDNAYVVQRLRRYIDYKYWSELEDIGGSHDTLQTNFTSFKSVTQDALKDIVSHLEKVSRDNTELIHGEASALKNKVYHDMSELMNSLDRLKNEKDGLQHENYQKILALMLELEKKLSLSQANMMSGLKQEFLNMIEAKNFASTDLIDSNHQRILELMQDLERKMDSRSVDMLNNLRRDLERLLDAKGNKFESNYAQCLQQIHSLENRVDSTQTELLNTFGRLKRELEGLLIERGKSLETQASSNHSRILELMVELEKKMDTQIGEQTNDLRRDLAKAIEDSKFSGVEAVQNSYKKVLELMLELEKRVDERQDVLLHDMRREFNQVLEQGNIRQEQVSNDNYKKSLELMLELEKKLDNRQNDLVQELRRDFAKIVAGLDNGGLRRELEEIFGRRLKELSERLDNQEKNLRGHFKDMMGEAETQLNRSIEQKIKETQSGIARLLDQKLTDTAQSIGRAIDAKLLESQNALQRLIDARILEQQNSIKKQVDERLEENMGSIGKLIDKKLESVESKIESLIERKLADSAGAIGAVIDKKILTAADDLARTLDGKLDEKLKGAFSRIDDKVKQMEDGLARMMDGKVRESANDLTRMMDKKLEDQVGSLRKVVDESISNSEKKLERDIQNGIKDAEYQINIKMDEKFAEKFSDYNKKVDMKFEDNMKNISSLIDQRIMDSQSVIGRLIEQKLADSAGMIKKLAEEKVNEAVSDLTNKIDSKIRTSQMEQDREWQLKLDEFFGTFRQDLDNRLSESMKELTTSIVNKIAQNNSETVKMLDERTRALEQAIRGEMEEKIQKMTETLKGLYDQKLQYVDDRVTRLEEEIHKVIAEALRNSEGGIGTMVREMMRDLKKEMEDLVAIKVKTGVEDMLHVLEQRMQMVENKMQAFDEELKQYVDIKMSGVQRTLETYVDGIFKVAEQNIIAQTIPRIEELEKQLKLLYDAFENFRDKAETDIGKVRRLEEAIREQIDMISSMNEKIAIAEDRHSVEMVKLHEEIDALSRRLNEMLGSFGDTHGLTDKLQDLLERVEACENTDHDQDKEIEHIKQRIHDELEAKLNLILKNREDVLLRIEQAEQEMGRMNAETRNEIDQIQMRHNSAIGLVDNKMENLIKVVQKLEEDVRIQVDRSIRDLESTDLRQQKEIADINDQMKEFLKNYEAFREMITRELRDEFAKINDNFENQSKIMAQKEAKLRSEIEQLRKEMQPLFALFDEVKALLVKITKLEEAVNLMRERLDAAYEKIKENRIDIDQIKIEIENIKAALSELDRLGRLIEEANKLWVFFQKFIDEQGMDHVKIIRSPDCSLTEKMFSMEWFARYTEFITPDTLIMAVNSFKEIYSGRDVEMSKNFLQHYHHQEGIPTILQSLRNLKIKIGQELMDIETYDQNNAMLLMLLEPLLINDLNHDMSLKLNGMVDITRLMMEQPVPSEIKGFEYNKKYVNSSFKYVLRCIAASVRNERGVMEFLANPKWLNRLLQILEEWKEEEQIANASKALRLIVRNDTTYDKLASLYPNLGNFLLLLLTQYANSSAIVVEAANAFRNMCRKKEYLSNVNAGGVGILFRLMSMPQHQSVHYKIAEAISMVNRNPSLAREVQKNGGVPSGYNLNTRSQTS